MTDYTREPAVRVFAPEYNESNHIFRESDDERAPKYMLLRTGGKANRVLIAGTLIEKDNVGDDNDFYLCRVIGPTGDPFFVNVRHYDDQALNAVRDLETPTYISVVGKVSSYEDDNGEVRVNIRAERLGEISEEERQMWAAETAQRTLDRIQNTEGKYVGMAEETYDELDRTEYVETVLDSLDDLDGGEDEDE
jgi:RPA family protein